MKHLLLLVFLLTISVASFSQAPDPDLFQTWYLRSVMQTDLDTYYEVSTIQPSILPTLTIIDDINFTGEGACNTFDGVFAFLGANNMQIGQFTPTTNACNVQVHDSFEDSYFNFMQSADGYTIIPDNQGLVLTIGTPLMGQAIFKNYTLNSKEFDLNQIVIYPNPANSRIYLNSPQGIITKIEFMNSIGQSIRTLKKDFEIIDISDLTSGMYFVKISTESGVSNKQIIKK